MSLITHPRQLPAAIFPVALSHLGLELCQNFLPLLYPLLIESMGLNYTQIGTLALMGSVFGSLIQPLFGLLSDRWDPRLIVVLSIAWSGTIMGLVGLLNRFELLLVTVALGALGSAAFHPAGATLAATGSLKRLGTSLSIFSVGGNIGAALSPLLVGAGLAMFGLNGSTLLIPVALLIAVLLFQYFRLMDFRLPAGAARSQSPSVKPRSWLPIGLIILIVAARSWFQGSLVTYLPEWLQSQGQSLETAGLMLSILLISYSVGSVTGGTLSDRIGRLPIVFVSLTALSLLHWLLLNSSGLLQLVWIPLIGMMIGSTFPVVIVMAQEVWPNSVGLASALVLGLGWLPSGLGSWVLGIIADRTTLTAALSFLIFVPLLGLAAALAFAWRSRPDHP